jgi:hypothetical protein
VKSSEIEVGKAYAVVRRRGYYENAEYMRKVTVLSPPKKGLVHVCFDEKVVDDGYYYRLWKDVKNSLYRSAKPFQKAHIPVRHFVSEWESFVIARDARREAAALEEALANETLKRSQQFAERIQALLAEKGIEAAVVGERNRAKIDQMRFWMRIDTTIGCERFEALLVGTGGRGALPSLSDGDGKKVDEYESALANLLSVAIGESS